MSAEDFRQLISLASDVECGPCLVATNEARHPKFCSLHATAPEMYEELKREYATCAPFSTRGRRIAAILDKVEGRNGCKNVDPC